MANDVAQIPHYDLDRDLAVYDAAEIEYQIDTGIYIACPGCGESNLLHRAVDSGCFDHQCGRGPWSVEIRHREDEQ